MAVAHGHLELVQKFLVRSLAGVSMIDALNSTEFERISDVQKTVKKLARSRQFPEHIMVRLRSLLNKATSLSRKRNEFVHRAVQMNRQGQLVQKRDDHTWGPAPTLEDLDELSQEILQLSKEINQQRLRGFIRDACKEHPLPAKQ